MIAHPRLPFIIAHRGASGDYPENTLEAFTQAKKQGAQWIETDTQLTRCGALILHHNAFFHPQITKLRQPIRQLSLQEIIKHVPKQSVVRLEDALEHLSLLQLGINIEMKIISPSDSKAHVATLARLLNQWGRPERSPILLSSFCTNALSHALALMPHSPRGLLYHANNSHVLIDNIKKISIQHKELQCCTFQTNAEYLTKENIQLIKNTLNTPLGAYTVNEKNHAHQLKKEGVNFIFSDFPNKLTSLN